MPGIKIREIVVGTGAAAERGKIVVAHIKAYLHRGEECRNTYTEGKPLVIDLSDRDHVPGLRKGVEGMLVGGKRELVVSPHLAYGQKGIPGSVPPNAVIRFEVELLDVRDRSSPPEPGASGRHLMVFRPGEAARNTARWQFGLQEDKSVAGVHITRPVPGATWRYARSKHYALSLDPSEAHAVFKSVESTFNAHREACLDNSQMWADSSEKANSISRDLATNVLCLSITIWEGGRLLLNYGLPETSPVLLNSSFYQIISRAIAPHLADVPKP